MNECICCGWEFPANQMVRAITYDRDTGEKLPEDQWGWVAIEHLLVAFA